MDCTRGITRADFSPLFLICEGCHSMILALCVHVSLQFNCSLCEALLKLRGDHPYELDLFTNEHKFCLFVSFLILKFREKVSHDVFTN